VKDLLQDTRVQRLLLANFTGSIGAGVTIIAVPWLLVQRPDGDRLYGYATLGTTFALFLLMPYYGAWLDRHSRKRVLLAGELFGAAATLAMALWGLWSGRVETWQLVTTYFCGMLYYTLHYPARFAFVQQTFERRHYQSLTGLMEIQGQTASVLAGGLASLFIDRVPLPLILFANAGTYLFSFVVQSTLPYRATHLESGGPTPQNAWLAMAEGGRWLRERPRLCLFLICTYVPFVAIMVGNYLFPIYVDRVLAASAAVFGRGEVVFAFGAILAGLLIPRLATRHGADQTIVFSMALFLAGLAMLALLHSVPLFYASLLLLGLGNAGSRVARSAIILTLVPNTVLGRVQMFFAAFDRLLRTVLTFGATYVVVHQGAAPGFAGLAAIAAAAFAGMLASRSAVRTTAPA